MTDDPESLHTVAKLKRTDTDHEDSLQAKSMQTRASKHTSVDIGHDCDLLSQTDLNYNLIANADSHAGSNSLTTHCSTFLAKCGLCFIIVFGIYSPRTNSRVLTLIIGHIVPLFFLLSIICWLISLVYLIIQYDETLPGESIISDFICGFSYLLIWFASHHLCTHPMFTINKNTTLINLNNGHPSQGRVRINIIPNIAYVQMACLAVSLILGLWTAGVNLLFLIDRTPMGFIEKSSVTVPYTVSNFISGPVVRPVAAILSMYVCQIMIQFYQNIIDCNQNERGFERTLLNKKLYFNFKTFCTRSSYLLSILNIQIFLESIFRTLFVVSSYRKDSHLYLGIIVVNTGLLIATAIIVDIQVAMVSKARSKCIETLLLDHTSYINGYRYNHSNFTPVATLHHRQISMIPNTSVPADVNYNCNLDQNLNDHDMSKSDKKEDTYDGIHGHGMTDDHDIHVADGSRRSQTDNSNLVAGMDHGSISSQSQLHVHSFKDGYSYANGDWNCKQYDFRCIMKLLEQAPLPLILGFQISNSVLWKISYVTAIGIYSLVNYWSFFQSV